MRLFLICILFPFQSFGQQDSLNAMICEAIQHAEKPKNGPPIYYFPFYNDVQLIEVDYFTYSQRDHVTQFVKTSKDSLWYSKHADGEQTNGYILRNSKGKVLKAYGIHNASGTYLLPPNDAPIITHKEHLNSEKSRYNDQSFTWKDGYGYGYRFAVTTIRERRTEMPEQAYHIFGILDTSGNVVIPAKHRTIEYFQGEYLVMLDISNTYAIYDSTFNKTYGYNSDVVERIGYNRYVKYGKMGGIMDRNGEFIMRYPFKSLKESSFSTDFIYSIEGHEPKFGILSKNFTFKTEPVYRRVGAFPTGYGVLTAGSNQFAIVNLSGQQITPFEYELSQNSDNSDGTFTLLKTTENGKKYGMIDTLGNTIIPFRYDRIYPFSNDIAIVELNKKKGVVDRSGNVQGEIVYDQIIRIDEEKIQVKIDDRTGYMNRNGVVVEALKHTGFESLDPKFIHFTGANQLRWIVNSVTKDTMAILPKEHFEKGFARVSQGGKMGMIDRTGNIVLPIKYDFVGQFYKGFLLVQKNGKYGLLNEKFKVIERLVHRYYRQLPNGEYEFYETQQRQ
ncbi:WG repeat-containing protein [uncultured Fluviicola sp.]|uniref:WG repeat-containing protein n=1 Tax=uncultured Fluviicola sp. TaxID=463303 RepID=UPI0025ED20AB|nr:WG repeat-containing protein [uncultured Fluviicola sp.]